ncbi:MAG: hypothetical protein ACUVX8_03015 [Candidatus Zipacnadales bacterium]
MVFLPLVVTALATWPRTSQSPLDAQERQAEIIRRVLEYGEKNYGLGHAPEPSEAQMPEASLIRAPSGRHTCAEGSLEYAVALLSSGVSPERADRIVQTLLNAQAGRGKDAGGFPWHPGEAPSAYATAYMAPWLAYIDQHLATLLPESTRARLHAALRPALQMVAKFDTKPNETQRYLVRTAAFATLATAIGDDAARGRAERDFAVWLKHVSEKGMAILQDPSATVVCVAALQWIWLNPPSVEARTGAGAALEYLYRDLALRFLPGANMVAGAAVNAHWGDYAAGTGATRYLLFGQFGRPALTMAEPFAMFLAIEGFSPNQETLALAQVVDTPRSIYSISEGRCFTTYVHPRYALGTLSGLIEKGGAPVVVTYGSEGEPNAYCEVVPLPARITSAQDEGMALVSLDFDNIGYEAERLYVSVHFHLGPRSALDAVLINQTPYAADFAAVVESKSAVVTEREGVYTAVIPIIAGPATVKPYDVRLESPSIAWEASGEKDDLVLTIPARTVRARETSRDNYRIAFAIEVGTVDDWPSVEAFATHIYDKSRASCEAKATRTKVGEKVEGAHKYLPWYNRPVERGKWIFEDRVVQELAYRNGERALGITEDLAKNEVIRIWQGGGEFTWDFLYRSPALNHVAGEALTSVFRPLPPVSTMSPTTAVSVETTEP